MIGLFCFDGPLYKDKNGIYCNVTLTNEMFERYFSVVDRLVLIIRTFHKNETYEQLNMKPLLLNKIEVIEAENFSNPKLFFKKKSFISRVC